MILLIVGVVEFSHYVERSLVAIGNASHKHISEIGSGIKLGFRSKPGITMMMTMDNFEYYHL